MIVKTKKAKSKPRTWPETVKRFKKAHRAAIKRRGEAIFLTEYFDEISKKALKLGL